MFAPAARKRNFWRFQSAERRSEPKISRLRREIFIFVTFLSTPLEPVSNPPEYSETRVRGQLFGIGMIVSQTEKKITGIISERASYGRRRVVRLCV